MKRLLFVLLAAVAFGVCGCGSDHHRADPVSMEIDGSNINIFGDAEDVTLPRGGPYVVTISGTANTITGPANCSISRLIVTGASNDAVFAGEVDEVTLYGASNTLSFDEFVTSLLSHSASDEVLLYGDIGSVTLRGSSFTAHLPSGSTPTVDDTGSSNTTLLYDLPAI